MVAPTPTRCKSAMKLFRLDTEAVIINEVVINEVRLRECLWNPRNACYRNKTDRYKAWEEIAAAVLPKYRTCSEDNKRRIVRAVQSRWKTALDAYMKCRLTEIKKPTYKARQHRFIYNKLRFLERVKDLFEDIDKDVNKKVKAPTHSADGNAVGTARLAAGQVAVRPAYLTKKPPNKEVPLGNAAGTARLAAGQVAVRPAYPTKEPPIKGAPLGNAAGTARLAAGQVAVRPAYPTKDTPNKGLPLGNAAGTARLAAGQVAVRPAYPTKEPPIKGAPLGNAAGTARLAAGQVAVRPAYPTKESPIKGAPLGNAAGTARLAAGQVAVRPAYPTKDTPNKGLPLGNAAGTARLAAGQVAVRPAYPTKEPPNKGVPLGNTAGTARRAAGHVAVRPPFPTKEPPNKEVPLGNAAGTARLAAGQVAVRPAYPTKEPPNKGVPLGKSPSSVPPAMCVAFKDNEEGSNSFGGDNSESQSTSTACDADDSEGSDEIMDFDIDIHDDFKEKIKDLVTASLPGGGKARSACGVAAATALLAAGQVAARPRRLLCEVSHLTKEPPNQGVPLGKSPSSVPPALCVAFKDNKEGSNSFVGNNCESQSTSTACDADDSEGSDEIMDFDIDIHDDFKDKIKHLISAFDFIDDKAVNENINQECLPGTSSQNNTQKDPLATADVTKQQKNSTSANTSALQTDDQLFFNSLAPLIDNFDIQQKLNLRSKIMEVVMEVGKIGPVNIKQERNT